MVPDVARLAAAKKFMYGIVIDIIEVSTFANGSD
jgi:hypothetical protein